MPSQCLVVVVPPVWHRASLQHVLVIQAAVQLPRYTCLPCNQASSSLVPVRYCPAANFLATCRHCARAIPTKEVYLSFVLLPTCNPHSSPCCLPWGELAVATITLLYSQLTTCPCSSCTPEHLFGKPLYSCVPPRLILPSMPQHSHPSTPSPTVTTPPLCLRLPFLGAFLTSTFLPHSSSVIRYMHWQDKKDHETSARKMAVPSSTILSCHHLRSIPTPALVNLLLTLVYPVTYRPSLSLKLPTKHAICNASK